MEIYHDAFNQSYFLRHGGYSLRIDEETILKYGLDNTLRRIEEFITEVVNKNLPIFELLLEPEDVLNAFLCECGKNPRFKRIISPYGTPINRFDVVYPSYMFVDEFADIEIPNWPEDRLAERAPDGTWIFVEEEFMKAVFHEPDEDDFEVDESAFLEMLNG